VTGHRPAASSPGAVRTVRKAVIPAAGLGTRLRPLTWAIPKELLPAGSVPLIQLAVEEAVASGIREVCIVIRREKEAIREYFERGAAGGAARTGAEARLAALTRKCRVAFAWQARPAGLGDAMRCARAFVGMEPFLLIIPDQFLCGPLPAARALLGSYRFPEPTILSSVVSFPRRERRFFPGIRGFRLGGGAGRGPRPVRGLVPAGWRSGNGPVAWGFGRTIYPPEIFPYLGPRYRDPRTGEVDLWRTIRALPVTIRHRAMRLPGRPCDLGTLEGYERYGPILAADRRRPGGSSRCAW